MQQNTTALILNHDRPAVHTGKYPPKQSLKKSYHPDPAEMPLDHEQTEAGFKFPATAAGLKVQAEMQEVSFQEAADKLQGALEIIDGAWQNQIQRFTLAGRDHYHEGEELLGKYYEQFWRAFPEKYLTEIVRDPITEDFRKLSNSEKEYRIRRFAHSKGKTVKDISQKAFENMEAEDKAKLLLYVRTHKGSASDEDYMPRYLSRMVKLQLDDLCKNFVQDVLADPFYAEFLGQGAVGAAFRLKVDGYNFVCKVPTSLEMTSKFDDFQYEQEELVQASKRL